ncbi:MAG: DUF2201 family putative metallopeptidase [Shewanella sp.]
MNQQEIDAFLRSCLDALVSNLDSTYYGRILSHLPMRADTSINSYAVSRDGEFLYNPSGEELTAKNKLAAIRSMLHEGMHIALEHFARASNIKAESKEALTAFNIAADCEIEDIIDYDFPYLKPDEKHHDCLKRHIPREDWGNGAEALYRAIYSEDGSKKPNPSSGDKPSDEIGPLSDLGKQRIQKATQSAANETISAINEEAVKKASSNTKQHNSDSGTGVGKSVVGNNTLKLLGIDRPKLTSFSAIEALFKNTYGREGAKDDSAFNQRHLLRRQFNGEALMGRHQRTEAEKGGSISKWHNDVVIYADVSGSMPREAVLRSFEFIYELASKYGVAPITVHTYNYNLKQTFVIDTSTNISKLHIQTGGGTSIANAFTQCPPTNKLVFVLTDMDDTPLTSWKYAGELVWLIHQNSHTNFHSFVGKKICINDIIRN